MQVETFTVGMLYTNCYLANCPTTKEAIIIDPGLDFSSEAKPIINFIAREGLKVRYIINTHGHDDHIKGDLILQQKYNVPVCIHPLDEHYLGSLSRSVPNVPLEEGNTVAFGNETLKVIHTPGHTPGSICLVGEKLVFTGDTLFAGSIGRTDFEGGSMKEMQASLRKLKTLPNQLMVYAGHGGTSLIGQEKRANPFLNEENAGWMF
ncbi:MAG TPA: MBL fold metallo-hydrolase [Candidatus Deferrimicrobiaceae bacterium]|nr:MBL fold metallo-hydrolase [Candidatus Deferrimicrobiaceae bacterium]